MCEIPHCMQFSPASYHFILLGSKYSTHDRVLTHPQSVFFPEHESQFSHPYKAWGQRALLCSCILIFNFLGSSGESKKFWTVWYQAIPELSQLSVFSCMQVSVPNIITFPRLRNTVTVYNDVLYSSDKKIFSLRLLFVKLSLLAWWLTWHLGLMDSWSKSSGITGLFFRIKEQAAFEQVIYKLCVFVCVFADTPSARTAFHSTDLYVIVLVGLSKRWPSFFVLYFRH
jgi:hypothetical protein